MANISKMTLRRRALWAAIGLTILTSLPLIAFLALTAAEFTVAHPGPLAMAAAAATLQSVSVTVLGIMASREARISIPTTMSESDKLRCRRRTDVLTNAILMTVSAGLSLGATGWLCSLQKLLGSSALLSPMSLVLAGLVLVVLNLIFESSALIILIIDSRESSSIVMLPPPEMIEAQAHWSDAETGEQPQAPSLAVVHDISEPPKTADSSTVSFRSSLTGSTRPSTSKNGAASSRPSSSSQSSQFDTWDTSAVPPPLRDTVHSRIAVVLPPIPGSRPASPAKALDGPFLPESPHPSQIALDFPSPVTATESFYSPPTSPRPPLHTSNSVDSIPRQQSSGTPVPDSADTPTLRHTYSQTSLADSVSHLPSRRLAKPASEENIHPLFRASSATPPPSASAGTILTAASIEEALGKRLNAHSPTAEALRGRSLGERTATSGISTRSSTRSRPRAATARSEAASPLATYDSWLVSEAEEPPSPERNPPPKMPRRNSARASTASPFPTAGSEASPDASPMDAFPAYAIAAAEDPQYAAFHRAASTRR